MKKSLLVPLLLLPLSLSSQGQELKLLADLNTHPSQAAASFPKGYAYSPATPAWNLRFLSTGKKCYFQARDGSHGEELWEAGSTPGSVRLVKDIVPGLAGSKPWDFASFRGKILFSAWTPAKGREVWISDGTAGGTRLLADLFPGKEDGGFHDPVPLGNSLFFFARVSAHPDRFALYRYDGGSAAPRKLKGGFSKPWEEPVPAGTFILFQGSTPGGPPVPWVSDGTPGGTRPLPGINAGRYSFCKNPVVLGGKAWFTTMDSQGWSIWNTDGKTAAKAGKVYLSGAWTAPLVTGGTTIVFGARTQALQTVNPYALDTKTGRISLLKTISTGYMAGYEGAVPWKGYVYFQAADSSYTPYPAFSLWRTDGTPKGTVKVVPEPSFPNWGWVTPAATSKYIFFSGKSWKGTFLWRTDGTAKGTIPLQGSPGGAVNTFPSYLTPLGPAILFSASSPAGGGELFLSDGTRAGTKLLKDIFPGNLTIGSSPKQFTAGFGKCWFLAYDSAPTVSNPGLWVTDGTRAGTRRILPGTTGRVENLFQDQGTLYFMVLSGSSRGLWKSDGTAAGTKLFYPTNEYLMDLVDPVGLSGKVIFQGHTGQLGSEPWVTGGTAASTRPLKDIYPGKGSGGFSSPVRLGRLVLFSAKEPGGITSLWVTDGTPPGTRKVLPGLVDCRNLVKLGDKVLFEGRLQGSLQGREPWITDGTPGGTHPVVDLYKGTGDGGFLRPFRAGDLVLFLGTDGVTSGPSTFGLYRTDGTAAGTARVGKSLFSGILGIGKEDGPAGIPLAGGKAVFWPVPAGGGDPSPWVTDGTARGTFALGHSFRAGRYITARKIGGGRLFFLALDSSLAGPFDPSFLWETDGTKAGTHPVVGLQNSGLRVDGEFALALGKVFLRLDDRGLHGPEPWILDPGASALAVGTSSGPAELESEDPILGRSFSLVFRGSPGGASTLLLLGFPCGRPLPLGPGAYLYLDPAPGFLWAGFIPRGKTTWRVPGLPSLAGTRLGAQGLVFPSTIPPFGADFTNGLVLTLGGR